MRLIGAQGKGVEAASGKGLKMLKVFLGEGFTGTS
jgi:hypothetical protein